MNSKIFASAILSILFLIGPCVSSADQLDSELLNSLKMEANHNLNRLKSLKEERKNSRIYEDQRERSLGPYLEEQENWEQLREKGLAEYRKQKKNLSPSDLGPEYHDYVQYRAKQRAEAEKTREVQVHTRNQMMNQNAGVISKLENEELGLAELRPRFELRFRGKNKWVKGGTSSGGRASSPGSFNSGGDSDGFPPPPPPIDYTPAPPPLDSYEDIPPPPPPPNYDYGAAVPFDAGYGDVPPPPPPPPSGGDYDF